MDKTIYDERAKRVKDAVALKAPDRVPFMPMIGNYYVYNYGLSMYKVMKDPTVLKEAFVKFMHEYKPDLVNVPAYFPADALETSRFAPGRWPGPYCNLPEDVPYQYIDKEYLDEDGYEEFFNDPSRFVLHKILPEKHLAFKAFEKIEPYLLTDSAIFSMAMFAEPDVEESLEKLLLTARQCREYLEKNKKIADLAYENSFPIFGDAAVMAPFDEFADHVRGIMDLCVDCSTQPENVLRAVKLWGDITICERVKTAKNAGAEYVFMPLHCGSDDFMSRANYEKFYWPGLRQAINAIIDENMTPLLFVEGKYNSKLPVLADVPKGKVIYVFENVDMKQAKEILGDKACIAGGMPTDYLMYQSKEKVIDKTKEIIDICAPGGGFIMSNSMSLDLAKQENMEAWMETTMTYGKY